MAQLNLILAQRLLARSSPSHLSPTLLGLVARAAPAISRSLGGASALACAVAIAFAVAFAVAATGRSPLAARLYAACDRSRARLYDCSLVRALVHLHKAAAAAASDCC